MRCPAGPLSDSGSAGRQAIMGCQQKVSRAVCKLVTNCIVLYCVKIFKDF